MSTIGRIHPVEWSTWMKDADSRVAHDEARIALDGVAIAKLYYAALRQRPIDLDGVRYGIGLAQRLMDKACRETPEPYKLDTVLATKSGVEYTNYAAAVRTLMRLSNAQMVNQGLEFWHRSTWALAGRQVYDVSPGLGERLAKTHLRGLVTDDLKLPYPSLYIAVPKRAGLRVYNEETGWHTLAGIYVTEGVVPLIGTVTGAERLDRGWRVMLWGTPKREGPDARTFEGIASERDRKMLQEADDALFHFSVPLVAGMPIEETIASVLRGVQREGPIEGETKAVFNFFKDAFQPTFEWLMNAILYATWPGGEQSPFIPDAEARALWERAERAPKGSQKRADLHARVRALLPEQKQRVTILGRSVKALDDDATGKGIPLTVRTLVEGHWQHYWVGPRATQKRERRWKQPYWRGPDDGVISTPIHRMVP